MDIIIREARVVSPGSQHHDTKADLLIAGGMIQQIAPKISAVGKAIEIKAPDLHISPGWVDMNVSFCDPGFEQKETIESGCAAAAAGGFTHVCMMPGTMPIIQTKAQIDYVLNKAKEHIVSVHPVGAMTRDLEGNDLADMYDMFAAGAIAFSDGLRGCPPAGVTERAMLYVKAFNGLLLMHPEDQSISQRGVMNEGLLSTRLGLPGAPSLAEEVAVSRDLYLLEYTNSRLHLLDISVKGCIGLIRNAKKKGLNLTTSVNAYNLLLDETAVGHYDTLAKVNPHLRPQEDVRALIKAIQDGTIDTITSQHNPQDEECKRLEFDKADFGMIGLETCYAVANTALDSKVTNSRMVEVFSLNARRILGLPDATIETGAAADLTLFQPELMWTFSHDDIRSRSKNTPFTGTSLKGKVLGIINKEKLSLNHGKI